MPTVLVVDDTASIRFLIRTNLEIADFEVAEAVDGVDCLEQLRAAAEAGTLPDAITVDEMMPRQGGVETIVAIRADPALKDLCVVMVTTQNLPADIRRGLEAGADAYLTKPFDPDDLIETLRTAIASRRA